MRKGMNRWRLEVWRTTGYGSETFTSMYRSTAKKNAGKRLTKLVVDSPLSPAEAIKMITGARLSNGVFSYWLKSYDGKNWIWVEEPGPGR